MIPVPPRTAQPQQKRLQASENLRQIEHMQSMLRASAPTTTSTTSFGPSSPSAFSRPQTSTHSTTSSSLNSQQYQSLQQLSLHERRLVQLTELEGSARVTITWDSEKAFRRIEGEAVLAKERVYKREKEALLRQQNMVARHTASIDRKIALCQDDEAKARTAIIWQFDSILFNMTKTFKENVDRSLFSIQAMEKIREKYFLKTVQVIFRKEIEDRRALILSEQYERIHRVKQFDKDSNVTQSHEVAMRYHRRVTILREHVQMPSKKQRKLLQLPTLLSPSPPSRSVQFSESRLRGDALRLQRKAQREGRGPSRKHLPDIAPLHERQQRVAEYASTREEKEREKLEDAEQTSFGSIVRLWKKHERESATLQQDLDALRQISIANHFIKHLLRTNATEASTRATIEQTEDNEFVAIRRKFQNAVIQCTRLEQTSHVQHIAHQHRVNRMVAKVQIEVNMYAIGESHTEAVYSLLSREEAHRVRVADMERDARDPDLTLAAFFSYCSSNIFRSEFERRTSIVMQEFNARGDIREKCYLKGLEARRSGGDHAQPHRPGFGDTVPSHGGACDAISDWRVRQYARSVEELLDDFFFYEQKERQMLLEVHHNRRHEIRAQAAQRRIMQFNRATPGKDRLAARPSLMLSEGITSPPLTMPSTRRRTSSRHRSQRKQPPDTSSFGTPPSKRQESDDVVSTFYSTTKLKDLSSLSSEEENDIQKGEEDSGYITKELQLPDDDEEKEDETETYIDPALATTTFVPQPPSGESSSATVMRQLGTTELNLAKPQNDIGNEGVQFVPLNKHRRSSPDSNSSRSSGSPRSSRSSSHGDRRSSSSASSSNSSGSHHFDVSKPDQSQSNTNEENNKKSSSASSASHHSSSDDEDREY